MHFGNDISNSHVMLDLNDQKRKRLEFITKKRVITYNRLYGKNVQVTHSNI